MSEIEFMTVQISAKTYTGFQYKIPKDIFNNMIFDEIVKETKDYMKLFFKQNNLYLLAEGIDNNGELHFHDDIPYNRDIIYLCDDSHGK